MKKLFAPDDPNQGAIRKQPRQPVGAQAIDFVPDPLRRPPRRFLFFDPGAPEIVPLASDVL
jgi:hypothetical protein